jgi:hypothetical protein
MKKLTTALGLILLTSLVFLSCSEKNQNEEITRETEDLVGRYFKKLDEKGAIYFINNKELIYSYIPEDGVVRSFKQKYSLIGNELTIHNKEMDDAEDKDDKCIIYNNEVIMRLFDGDRAQDYSQGMCYRLSE